MNWILVTQAKKVDYCKNIKNNFFYLSIKYWYYLPIRQGQIAENSAKLSSSTKWKRKS